MSPDIFYLQLHISAYITQQALVYIPNYKHFPLFRLDLCVIKKSHSFAKSLAGSRTHNFICIWAVLLVYCCIFVSLKCAFANLPVYFFPYSRLRKRAVIPINSQCHEGGHNGTVTKTFFRRVVFS